MIRPLLLAALIGFPAAPLVAKPNAGAYLAGRQAQLTNDFQQTVAYLGQAMRGDPRNIEILESLAGAYVSLNQFDRAETIARRVTEAGAENQVANLILMAGAARGEDWGDLLDDLDAGLSVGPLFDGLVRGWALLGDGQTDAALAAFEGVSADQGVALFGTYHKGLALAALGRFEAAETVLSQNPNLKLARRGVVAQAQILSQIGRFDDAIAALDAGFGGDLDPTLQAMHDRLAGGEALAFDIAPDARAGIAEASYDIASVLAGDAGANYTLLYSRIVTYLRPGHTEATLLSAQLLDDLGQHDLAIETFATVPSDDPAFDAAELGRAEVLREAGREDAAIEVLRQLARARPDVAVIQVSLGDALRQMKRFDEALAAYDTAIRLADRDGAEPWPIYFSRAITRERTGDWPGAEADFRRSLELSPDQPQVLNYLGYSLVERHENLDEALDMIKRAAAARPDSGPITDSLGWVLYRVGRYAEAVTPMEDAVALMPVDPVVNDHLGDVYWAVGRKLEARFQWKRALSFVENDENDEVKPERIRRKLDLGLDRVLEEEGAAPLRVADER